MTRLWCVGSILAAFWVALSGPAQSQDLRGLLEDAISQPGTGAILYVTGEDRRDVVTRGQLKPQGRGVRSSDRFVIASLGKIFTAVAVLQLAEAGKLGLDDPIEDWIDSTVADGLDLSDVTLRHLLTMTSGVEDYYAEDYFLDVLDNPDRQTPVNALRYAGDALLFEPGTRFDYSNSNYVLLQLVIESASGQSMSDYFQKNLFDPVGMPGSFVFGSRALPDDFVVGFDDIGDGPQDMSFYYEGAGFGDGGVISTARDVGRFYRALLVQKRILKEETLEIMLTDPVGEGYGMGIEIEDVPGFGRVYGHSGADLGYTADVRLDAKTGTVAVVLIASDENAGGIPLDALKLLTR